MWAANIYPEPSPDQFYSPLLSPSDQGALSRLCDHLLQRSDQGHEEAGLRRDPERHAGPFPGASDRGDAHVLSWAS